MDLFDLSAALARAPVEETPERLFLESQAASCFRERSTEPIWKWADREVWISEKMAARPRLYDSSFTPWTREWQELPLRDDIRAAVAMKDSRSGFTEASLNILRWMPEHWPGGVLYSINSRDKAREVCEKRILPSLEALASAQFTEDPDDATLSKISLLNMDILVSGSGSSGPFMEAWYRLIILDELENHQQLQGTNTFDRARSRQQDVPDGLLLAMSKPERAGGIIDLAYIGGSQKKWMVPCPRCERRIELSRKLLVYSHCEEPTGWNLARVLTETHYQCLLCGKPFYESEKRAMVNEGLWVPTPLEQRRLPPSGKHVPPDPSVESYHMSSYYSLHERSTCGDLAVEILKAEVINPTPEGKKYVRTNFDGLPYEPETISLTIESLRSLIAGHVEQTTEKTPEGEERQLKRVLAHPILMRDRKGTPRDPAFRLAYLNGGFNARLPFKPDLLTIFTDKQFNHLKFLVFALLADGTPFLIDLGLLRDEDAWIKMITERAYHIDGEDEPMFITDGLIDCGHRPQEVFRACLKLYDLYDRQIWPAKGEGEAIRRDEGEDKAVVKASSSGKRIFRHVQDWVDGRAIIARYFVDHHLKSEFYHTRLQGRADPRPWLPTDTPTSLFNEWMAEKYNEQTKAFEHNKTKAGPNDYGDCGKLLYLWLAEKREELKKLAGDSSGSVP